MVDGRDSVGVGACLTARPQGWRDGVEAVAIDPSAAFRKAMCEHLPAAAVSVGGFYADVRAMPMWSTFVLPRAVPAAVRSAQSGAAPDAGLSTIGEEQGHE